ncbi:MULTISPECIES: YkgJ family cysteine cluster protein [Aquitalea]|uniref:YkgJ family cysteine cluster protein n=1 Tax=Aquitalea TaxID=407217 RepID=UPI00135C0F19|nr:MULTISPECIES: YkgJ family cysteine cluster protein [Aquitalea]
MVTLSKEESAALQASIRQVSQRVARELQARPGVGHALHFISHLHAGIDKIVMQAEQRGQAPACQAACNSCCYLRVEASQAEVLLIARHLRQGTLPQLQEIRQRLLQRQQHMQAATAPLARLACAFLQDGLCSIYPLRPASCRKAHSFSAAACHTQAAEIPQDLSITLAAEALQRGTAAGYRQAGLAADPLELTAAMLWALDDAGAEEGWLAGQGDRAG